MLVQSEKSTAFLYILSEAEPHAMYVIYKQKLTLCSTVYAYSARVRLLPKKQANVITESIMLLLLKSMKELGDDWQ